MLQQLHQRAQVAAAAALWIEKNKHELPRDWRRVEAVRFALFESAHKGSTEKERKEIAEKLGQGILRASDALSVAPMLNLPKTKADDDSWALLRVLTGLGIAEMPPREQMYNLELQQRWLVNPRLQELIPDPDSADLPTIAPSVLARIRRDADVWVTRPTDPALILNDIAQVQAACAGRPRGPLRLGHFNFLHVVDTDDREKALRAQRIWYERIMGTHRPFSALEASYLMGTPAEMVDKLNVLEIDAVFENANAAKRIVEETQKAWRDRRLGS